MSQLRWRGVVVKRRVWVVWVFRDGARYWGILVLVVVVVVVFAWVRTGYFMLVYFLFGFGVEFELELDWVEEVDVVAIESASCCFTSCVVRWEARHVCM